MTEIPNITRSLDRLAELDTFHRELMQAITNLFDLERRCRELLEATKLERNALAEEIDRAMPPPPPRPRDWLL